MKRPATPVAISYSGGSSSKWIIYAMLNGEIPRPDHVAVFFADTGAEHEWTYADVARTEADCAANELPFFRCAAKESLTNHLLAIPSGTVTRRELPPFSVAKDGGGRGMIMQRCTYEFKIAPMRRAQTIWLRSIGQPKRVITWIGFGTDEQHRATKSVQKLTVAWVTLDFPAIRLRRNRYEQRADLARWGVAAPPFSMCVFCPLKTDARWHATPESQRVVAIAVDEAIRDCEILGITDGPVFASSQLRPLSAVFAEPPREDRQLELFPDVPGCDGGHCFL